MLFVFNTNSKAVVAQNAVSIINMNVYVDNNGNAHVTETIKCNVTNGTELRHACWNLNNAYITDFSVKESDIDYKLLPDWHDNDSFENIAYSCAINEISEGNFNLCWGIGTKGQHTYTLNYTINNFVTELNDSQIIHSSLLQGTFFEGAEEVNITIFSDFKYKSDTFLQGYGNDNTSYSINDGCVEIKYNGKLTNKEDITILAKFPSNTFNTENKLNKGFNEYRNSVERMIAHKTNFINNMDKIALPMFIVGIILLYFNKRKLKRNMNQ